MMHDDHLERVLQFFCHQKSEKYILLSTCHAATLDWHGIVFIIWVRCMQSIAQSVQHICPVIIFVVSLCPLTYNTRMFILNFSFSFNLLHARIFSASLLNFLLVSSYA